MLSKKQITKIRVPKGFFFRVEPTTYGNVYVKLYRKTEKTTRKIGHISLVHDDDKLYETHSTLARTYRNKGLGALMYAKAIQWCLERGYKVKSSGASSSDAQRVWRGKTLKKYFNIKLKKYKYDSSPEYDTWFATAKRMRNATSNRRGSTKRKTSRVRTLR